LTAQPNPVEQPTTIPLTGMRGAVAHAMTASLQTTAQFTLQRRVRSAGVEAVRDTPERRYSVNDVLLVTVARVLGNHRLLNATLVDDELRLASTVNLGMAVALADGLVVPVIHGADELTAPQLAVAARDLATKARERKLTARDIADGTFTVTNLGGYGIDGFTPILNTPQVGILGVGRIYDGQLTLSLTIDHRAVDGAPGALFLADLAEALESATPL
jgi:pyruvate dehydrogenase E2 component (dihydrolipoamide acetyltransferase)